MALRKTSPQCSNRPTRATRATVANQSTGANRPTCTSQPVSKQLSVGSVPSMSGPQRKKSTDEKSTEKKKLDKNRKRKLADKEARSKSKAPKKPIDKPKKAKNKKSAENKAQKNKRIKRKGKRDSDVSADLYVATSPIHGRGMFAETRIKKNVVLGKLEGKPTKSEGTYVLWLTAKKGLRLTNDFRFINHDKKPNCALTGKKVVTLRSIKQDEELTHDYGW